MRSRRDTPRLKSPQRTPVAVLAAMFALIVQLMVPSAAMAAETGRPGETMIICTGMGVETVQAPMDHPGGKGFAGLPCQDCLAPASAALPAPFFAPISVAYAVTRIERPALGRFVIPPARAPPRPPGQGPPSSNV